MFKLVEATIDTYFVHSVVSTNDSNVGYDSGVEIQVLPAAAKVFSVIDNPDPILLIHRYLGSKTRIVNNHGI